MSNWTPEREAAIRHIATRGVFPGHHIAETGEYSPNQYPGGSLAALQQALEELDRLRAIVDQVDGVLIVNWVGPRTDGDYRLALHDLVTFAIQIENDPAVSSVAAQRVVDKKCAEIVRAILDISNERFEANAEGWAIAFGPDWGGPSLTIERPEMGHTHIGDFMEGGTFEGLVDGLHAQLLFGRGLSWAAPQVSQTADDVPHGTARHSGEASTAADSASLTSDE